MIVKKWTAEFVLLDRLDIIHIKNFNTKKETEKFYKDFGKDKLWYGIYYRTILLEDEVLREFYESGRRRVFFFERKKFKLYNRNDEN